MTNTQNKNAMSNELTEKREIELLKLAKVADAARALAIASDYLKMKPEEVSDIVVALAKKFFLKQKI